MGSREDGRVKRNKQRLCFLPTLPLPLFAPQSPPMHTVNSQAAQNSEVHKVYIQDSIIGEITFQKRSLQGSIGNMKVSQTNYHGARNLWDG